MLITVNAKEILQKTVDIILRVKLEYIGEEVYEQERDRYFFMIENILESIKTHPEAKNFTGLKILDKNIFLHGILPANDKLLAVCMFSQLRGDIAGVYVS